MKCSKCGTPLDDNAVFCDLCGSFVMNSEYKPLPNNGCRSRHRKSGGVWIIILISAVLSGFTGTCIGYGIIVHDSIKKAESRMSVPTVSKKHWEESLFSDFLVYKHRSADNGNTSAGNTSQ